MPLNIVLLSPYVPYPPHGGALIRLLQQIRFLGQRHALTLALIASTPEQREQAQGLKEVCEAVHFASTASSVAFQPGQPRSVEHYRSPEMLQILRSLSNQRFDLALIHFVYMAQYIDCLSAPAVLEEHNIESELFRQQARLCRDPGERVRWRSEGLQLEAYENQWWPRFDLRVTTTPDDRRTLNSRCSSGRTVVVPNGADCESGLRPLRRESDRLLFCGLLNYPPNQDAAELLVEEVMPLIWERTPMTRLIIAGARPERRLFELMEADSRLELVADPDDMRTVADGCSSLIVPLRAGSGSRVKILEALAWGLPVVSTPVGREGLELEEGRHILTGSDAQGLADAVVRLQKDEVLWERLRQEGRIRVEERYRWESIWTDWEVELQAFSRQKRSRIPERSC